MPLQSMTGYARVLETTDIAQYQIELRSVNHKYLALNVRLPKMYTFLEPTVHKVLKNTIKRGKIDVSIQIKPIGNALNTVKINRKAAQDYFLALDELRRTLDVSEPITMETILSNTEIVDFTLDEKSEKRLTEDLVPLLEKALSDLLDSRISEGGKLTENLSDLIRKTQDVTNGLEENASHLKEYYIKRVRDNLGELLNEVDRDYSEERLELELSMIAEKADIREEIARIQSHLSEMRDYLNNASQNELIGAKLNFFCQELGREFNTIGSKNRLKESSSLVIEGKSLVNSIREQVYNIQ